MASCITENLNYSNTRPTQSAIQEVQWSKHPCLTSLDGTDSPLEFRIDKTNSFVDLNQTYLQVSFSILKADGKQLADKDVVSTANIMGYSMFSSVDLYIQDQKVTQDQGMYPWMMYVKILSGCTNRELACFVREALYRRDVAGAMEEQEVAGDIRNMGYVERAELVKNSSRVEMMVKFGLDFTIDRLIPDQTEIFVRFRRAPAQLCLMAKKGQFKLRINTASLLVQKVVLTHEGLRQSHSLLSSRGLTYPSVRCSMRSKVVSKNDQNCEWVPFSGILPKRIFIFQISQAAFNGDITKNIYNFQHFNLKQIHVAQNDEGVPLSSAVQIDWNSPGLLYLISTLALGDASKVHYDSWDFANGYALMCFDLTSDKSAFNDNYVSALSSGTLRIRLDYDQPLSEPISIICVGEFDAQLVIDKDRNVSWNS